MPEVIFERTRKAIDEWAGLMEGDDVIRISFSEWKSSKKTSALT